MNRCGNNRGVCLAELLIAMPLMAMLAAGMILLFSEMVKQHVLVVNQLEMQQQVRFAMAGVVDDITYAESATCKKDSLALKTKRKNALGSQIVYVLDKSKNSGRLMKDNQPVTGAESKSTISITDFHVEPWNERTIMITITAVNQTTRQSYTLESAAVLLNHANTSGGFLRFNEDYLTNGAY